MTSAPLPRGGHTAFCVLAGLFPGLPDSYWVGATANRGRVWPLLETFGLPSVSVYIWQFFKKQSSSEWSVTDIDRLLKSHYLHFPECWEMNENSVSSVLLDALTPHRMWWNKFTGRMIKEGAEGLTFKCGLFIIICNTHDCWRTSLSRSHIMDGI